MPGILVSAPTATGIAWVSKLRGPDTPAVAVVVRNASAAAVTAAMDRGGFDPVGIAARTGDTLRVTLVTSTGDSIRGYAIVPQTSRPVVLRTSPLGRSTGVSPADTIVAVFSEPMDASSLSGGVLLEDSNGSLVAVSRPVAGCEDGLCANLVPTQPLAGYSTYTLQINTTVRSRAGAYLDLPLRIWFTTGTWVVGPPTLVVRRFTVIEYRVPGDTVNWYYAPQLTVSDTAAASGALVDGIQLSLPGLDPIQLWACTPVIVSFGQSVAVFLEADGEFEGSFSQTGKRATAGDVTGVLHAVDGGYSTSLELLGQIVSGQPPLTNTARAPNWSPYCE